MVKNFQKRHLISHNDGIVDDPYIQITNDQEAVKGRKIKIASEDVENMLESIEIIARNIQEGLSNWKSKVNEIGENDA